jgi:cellulose synthase/poly-beta-1,6-N-acetylglucosamine synthase-like glycosyltransferase
MHLFERSIELPKHKSQREYHYPLQCILALKVTRWPCFHSHAHTCRSAPAESIHGVTFAAASCLQERNGGKLNSHLWFFSGFSVQLNPKYCALMDVGTVPQKARRARVPPPMHSYGSN